MIFQDFLETNKKAIAQSTSRCVLAVDSTTQVASVAISQGSTLIYSEDCIRQKSHSEWINSAVERALHCLKFAEKEIDVIAVGHGPGSFTGLRVANNLVKTLAYSWNKPVVSYSSLEILALQTQPFAQTNYVLSIINAFKNMVYFALFERQSEGELLQVLAPDAIDVLDLKSLLFKAVPSLAQSKVLLVGDGYMAYRKIFEPDLGQYWIRDSSNSDFPMASTLAMKVNRDWLDLKLLHWREVMPTYIRSSAAEENQIAKLDPK